MADGYFGARLAVADNGAPVIGAKVDVYEVDGKLIRSLITDESGNTDIFKLDTFEKQRSLDESNKRPAAIKYNITITKDGYIPTQVLGAEIYDEVYTLQVLNFEPKPVGTEFSDLRNEYSIPQTALNSQTSKIPLEEQTKLLNKPARLYENYEVEADLEAVPAQKISLAEVYIPDMITVHMGPPNTPATNVTLPFTDYIKNVASSEIYPTWPRNSLFANIYAQISLALNRIYTEWYTSKGYNFNITNTTAYDQAFVQGRPFFDTIIQIVDEIFNVYIKRRNFTEPFFAEYCNGTTTKCSGMSQWGTVTLAEQGYTPIQILRNYYPKDILLQETDDIKGIVETYPGTPIKFGSTGDNVARIQTRLNRIGENYKTIPHLQLVTGIFGPPTQSAVLAFQKAFHLVEDGIVGKATWYRIENVYVAVTKLAELQSEGDKVITYKPPKVPLKEGSTGNDVLNLQFALYVVSYYYREVSEPPRNGVFDEETKNSVISFQRKFKLPPNGIVTSAVWDAIFKVIDGIRRTGKASAMLNYEFSPIDAFDYSDSNDFYDAIQTQTTPQNQPTNPPYPGTELKVGSRGENVRIMQAYLNAISDINPVIPKVKTDGVFGPMTRSAVVALQILFNLQPTGIIDKKTWDQIVNAYNAINFAVPPPQILPVKVNPPYPGKELKRGSRGPNVLLMQNYLNEIADDIGDVPKVKADGIYGHQTEAAVKAFERLIGNPPDGIIEENTWDDIVTVYNQVKQNPPPTEENPLPPTETTPQTRQSTSAFMGLTENNLYDINGESIEQDITAQVMPQNQLNSAYPPYPGTEIKVGSTGSNVRMMQGYLNDIANLEFLIPKITVDGIFGLKTQGSVNAFKILFNLKPDGIIDKETWNDIVGYRNIIINAVFPFPTTPVSINPPYPGTELKTGSRGDNVRLMQSYLYEIAEDMRAIPMLKVDGVYGPETEAVVKSFESLIGNPPDGIIEENTWDDIVIVYNQVLQNPPPYEVNIPEGEEHPFSSSVLDTEDMFTDIDIYNSVMAQATPQNQQISPQYPGTELKLGSRGENVRIMQAYLNDVADLEPLIPKISVDGVYGPKTESAVRAYQLLFNLRAYGVINKETWDSIVNSHNIAVSVENPTPIVPINVTPPFPGVNLRRGSRGNNVRLMQNYLNTISNVLTTIQKLKADGIYGPMTERAVNEFDRLIGNPPDGMIDRNTWDDIVTIYNQFKQNPPPHMRPASSAFEEV